MASQTRQAREADRKLSVQTLAIASISSALAAVIVSQFWKSGTAPAAAITPVVVTVLSELLHKPTQAITSRVTSDRSALLPEGAGAGAPPQRRLETVTVPARDSETTKPFSEERPPPLHDEDGEAKPSDERPSREAPITYHRAGSNGSSPKPGDGRSWRDRINLKIVAATAALAFVIGAAILTIPELVSGGSVGKAQGGTTLFGGDRSSTQDESEQNQDPQDSEQQQDQPSDQGSDGSSGQSQQQQDSGGTQRQKTTETQPKSTPQQQQQQRAPATPQQTPAQP